MAVLKGLMVACVGMIELVRVVDKMCFVSERDFGDALDVQVRSFIDEIFRNRTRGIFRQDLRLPRGCVRVPARDRCLRLLHR